MKPPLSIALLGCAALLLPPAFAGGGECGISGLKRCPEPRDASVPAAESMLRWTPAERVVGFRNTWRQYGADVFHADPHNVLPLPAAHGRYRPPGLAAYLQQQSVTGLLILRNGQVLEEYYGSGNGPGTLWTSRSVAKSIVSILIGMAIREGSIGGVEDPVTKYIPELRQTAWDRVTLEQLLQHTSGVRWNENYEDPASDFAALTRCEAGAEPFACVMGLVRGLQRRDDAAPGEVWSYNTAGAWLAGLVLERATGTTIAHFLETRIWQRVGMQADGVWQALAPGVADMGGHGFNATLRDWGRFGWLVARGGQLRDGTSLLPPGWLQQSTRWTLARGSVSPENPQGQYGYQWWHAGIPAGHEQDGHLREWLDQTLWAEGIFGQTIAIDPRHQLVMVQWSVWPHAEMPPETYDQQALFFAGVAGELRR